MNSRLYFKEGSSPEDIKIKEKSKITETANSANELATFFDLHKIYFKPELCDLIEKVRKEYFDSYYDFIFDKKYNIGHSDLVYQKLKASSDRVRKEIPPLLKNIEFEFRLLTGVIESGNDNSLE